MIKIPAESVSLQGFIATLISAVESDNSLVFKGRMQYNRVEEQIRDYNARRKTVHVPLSDTFLLIRRTVQGI